ncbi:MAG: hypothetical protein RLZ98_2688 [Pseudomonadota bacterium]|jgi:metallo-beta-lactamase class B
MKQPIRIAFAALLLHSALLCAAEVDHQAAGRAAAAADFPGLGTLCGPPSPKVTPELVRSRPWSMPEGVPATRVFDNLYFVGHKDVSAWVLRTSKGLVLIDALAHEKEAPEFIEGGLRKLGLDPADIRILLITHGHGDHYGGARYIVERYHPQVVMSAIDWAELQKPGAGMDVPGWDDPPRPDRQIRGRESVRLGDTRITTLLTPGHTLGTLSLLFQVRDGKNTLKALLWGGTGFNFGDDPDRYRQYAASAEDTRQLSLREGVEVFLSNHVRRDQADVKIAALATLKPGDAHPFVLPPERTARAFEVFRDCSLAQIDRLQASPAPVR